MQITLNQDEIEQSVRNHVLSQLAIREDQEISIDLRAGRGENGFTATLDVRPRQGEANGPKPAFAKVDEAKQGPRLVGAESQKEEKTGISTQKAEEPQKPAASKAPKKGIFATAAKAAPEPVEEEPVKGTGADQAENPEDTDIEGDTGRGSEPDEPVTAAEEDAHEDAQDGNEAPAEQSAEQPGSKKSIFTFAPKTSAG